MLLLFRQKHFKPIRIDLFDYPTYLIFGRRYIVEAHHHASKKKLFFESSRHTWICNDDVISQVFVLTPIYIWK